MTDTHGFVNFIVESSWRSKHFGVRTATEYYIKGFKDAFGSHVSVTELSVGDACFSRAKIELINRAAINVIANPWIIANLQCVVPRAVGVVHDIAPILCRLGILDLSQASTCYEFHNQHVYGYEYYNKHCRALVFNSEETLLQYEWLYGQGGPGRFVIKPFDFDSSTANASAEKTYDVGLVNIFDLRKNYVNIFAALRRLARPGLKIAMLGEMRIDPGYIEEQLHELDALGVQVERVTEPDHIYSKSRLLLFPTFYEGFGLPVFEAQSHGTPVISGTCGLLDKYNAFPELVVQPDDVGKLTAAVSSVLERNGYYLDETRHRFGSISAAASIENVKAWQGVRGCFDRVAD